MSFLQLVSFGLWSPTRPKEATMPTVAGVDLTRLEGCWYEIASIPTVATCRMTGTTFTFRMLHAGEQVELTVRSCDDDGRGREEQSTGKARILDPGRNARLHVGWSSPLAGDYWIVSLGESYEHLMLAQPSRRGLWILSRGRDLPEEVMTRLLREARRLGYDPDQIMLTPQDVVSETPRAA
jgi:apolipoprotein D and lipocalin family protein